MKTVRVRDGFTLVELIVVIGVLAVVTTLGVTAFVKMADLSSQTRMRMDLNAVADNAFEQMRKDFTEVLSPRLAGRSLTGTPNTVQNRTLFWSATLDSDQVVVPVQFLSADGQRRFGGVVAYQVDRGTNTLTRSAGGLVSERPDAALVTNVIKGVVHLSVEYMPRESGAAWVRNWSKPELPRAVRVSLTLMDPTRSYEQITRKAVFPIYVE